MDLEAKPVTQMLPQAAITEHLEWDQTYGVNAELTSVNGADRNVTGVHQQQGRDY